jgi:hypothetical protein
MDQDSPPSAATTEKAEKTGARIALAVSVVILVGAIVPYWYAWAHCPPDRINLGLAYNIQDQLLYLSWIRQCAEGGPVYNLMTTVPHPALPSPNIWALLGWVVRVTGLSVNAVYHLSRLVFTALYLLVLWPTLRLWLPRVDARVGAFVAIAGGSGLGWFTHLVQGPSGGGGLDQYMAELWTYFSILLYPHFAASLLLLTGIWWCLWHLWWGRAAHFFPVATLFVVALLLMADIHPYTYLPLLGGIGLYTVLFGRADAIQPLRRAVVLLSLLPGAGLLAMQNHEFMANPVLRQWAIQNDLQSPPFMTYVEGFGLPAAAAAFTILVLMARALARRHGTPAAEPPSNRFVPEAWAPASTLRFCAIWVVVTFILVYAYPWLRPARRCIEGAHLFLVVLAVPALLEAAKPLLRRGLWPLAAVAALALFPTSVMVAWTASTETALRAPAALGPIWRYIDTHLPRDAGIFTDHYAGVFIPAMTGRRTYIGHFHLTPRFEERLAQVAWFFSPAATDRWRADALRASNCRYVLSDRAKPEVTRDLERLLGPPLIARGQFALYRIPHAPPSP